VKARVKSNGHGIQIWRPVNGNSFCNAASGRCKCLADNFVLQTGLSGHQGKVISCDVSPRGRSIASGGWDDITVYDYLGVRNGWSKSR
jgi:WD40 repeat protein